MARTSNFKKLAEIAALNLGVVTLEQARNAGVPSVEVHKLAKRGSLERVGTGVYRAGFFPRNEFSDAHESVLAVNADAWLAGESVLSLLNIGNFNPRKRLVKTTKRFQRKPPSATLVKVVNSPQETTVYGGVRCEPVFLALQSVGAYTPINEFESSVDRALALDYLTEREAAVLLEVKPNR